VTAIKTITVHYATNRLIIAPSFFK